MRHTAHVRFARSIDLFLDEARRGGRINSRSSERAYRDVLTWHAEDAETTDPRRTTREDVRRTLRRWQHPNTQRNRHSLLASFYRWMFRRGIVATTPPSRCGAHGSASPTRRGCAKRRRWRCSRPARRCGNAA